MNWNSSSDCIYSLYNSLSSMTKSDATDKFKFQLRSWATVLTSSSCDYTICWTTDIVCRQTAVYIHLLLGVHRCVRMCVCVWVGGRQSVTVIVTSEHRTSNIGVFHCVRQSTDSSSSSSSASPAAPVAAATTASAERRTLHCKLSLCHPHSGPYRRFSPRTGKGETITYISVTRIK